VDNVFAEIVQQVRIDIERMRLMLPDVAPEDHTEYLCKILECEAALEQQILIFNAQNPL
jgi:hypothetical protein